MYFRFEDNLGFYGSQNLSNSVIRAKKPFQVNSFETREKVQSLIIYLSVTSIINDVKKSLWGKTHNY